MYNHSVVIMITRLIDKDNCTGCYSCYNICPVNAIEMTAQNYFIYPKINTTICIKCEKCIKACPLLDIKYANNKNPDCYAAINKNIRNISSSGGIFSTLSEYILQNQGIVCGAAFTENFNVEHIIISDVNELDRLRRSKYVQSKIGHVYSDLKLSLDSGKKVLFAGCPCQIAGFNSFLGKDYPNLFLIGLVCHGVPSAELFQKYLEEEHEINNISIVNFRDKKINPPWKKQRLSIEYKNGTKYCGFANTDPFVKQFSDNLGLRKSCGQCPFAKIPRQEDITLFDFWKIKEYDPTLDDEQGTSGILINSEKGNNLFEKIKINLDICVKVPLETAFVGNPNIRRSSHLHINRDFYIDYLKIGTMKKAIEFANHQTFHVALFGDIDTSNYGLAATYYCLYNMLWQNKISTTLLCSSEDVKNSFLRNNCHTTKINEDLQKCNNDIYEILLIDENKQTMKNKDLKHLSPYKNKIVLQSLSPYEIGAEEYDEHITGNEDFPYILPLISKKYIDCDFSIKKIIESDDYISTYILGPSLESNKIAERISNELKIPVFNTTTGDRNKFKIRKSKFTIGTTLVEINLKDWFNILINSKFIITDSIYAVIIALTYNIDFLLINNESSKNTISIMKKLNLQHRMISIASELETIKKIDFLYANKVIAHNQANTEQQILNLIFRNNHISENKDIDSFESNNLTKKKYDIGLIGFGARNIGNNLTNYALYTYLTDCGYTVLTIGMNGFGKLANSFITMTNTEKVPTYYGDNSKTSLKSLNEICNVFIIGSDQVFNQTLLSKGFSKYCLLDWVSDDKTTIAFSSSFGVDKLPTDNIALEIALKRMKKISFRENNAVIDMNNQYDLKSTWVVDPVFLLTRSHYELLVKKAKLEKPFKTNKFICAYLFDNGEKTYNYLRKIKDITNIEFCLIITGGRGDVPLSNEFEVKNNCNAEYLIAQINQCEIFVTDSYHGTCFALMFNKPLIIASTKHHINASARIPSLLDMVSIPKKLIVSNEDNINLDLIYNTINYDAVNIAIKKEKEKSINWLFDAINDN